MLSDAFERLMRIDFYLVVCVMLLGGIGCVALYSAAGGHVSPWMDRQIVRFALGLVVFLACTMADIRFFRNAAYVLYALSIVLLIIVEIKGHIGMGAQRWINLGVIKLQPSEVAKITVVLALARYFYDHSVDAIGRLRTYITPLVIIAVPSLLLLRQPDLGTMLLLGASGCAVIFVAGIRLWKVIAVLASCIGAAPIFWMLMHDYQKRRILTFLNPEDDPLGAGYHIMQSKISIGSGGFWGKGFLSGTQSQLNFLPEKQTDFIFAHLCEEFGFVGGTFVILVYGGLLAVCIKMAFECRSFFSRLYIVGFSMLLFLYVFVNIAMVMGLLPVVGVPLPFVSYGGTSVITLMFGLGVLSSCYVDRNARFGQHF